ncbi:hypothetical protein IA817_11205 [Listeria seeligeri]|uniref:Uncharacterized protein n=2 Tax=Listeria seeligeri TaxID=1640 RepID=A0ABR5EBQ9_LISSE|nr:MULTISPECIES: hypothetical protein [Listeria]EFS01609.1 hypothetical protein NT03LS_0177 [Listeria seeligeri FSL N1-067]KKD50587.1 hypothetical protein UQ68_01780 [Listeria seeligeri]MBC2071387.1 hypothetical protein [Listeria seeligeri]MBC2087308.1 hypothetical protein [Listeria seeligeri]MBF2354797.1 hypothetical protein [Listeria seeligeri]
MEFRNKKTGEIKKAYSIEDIGDKYGICFVEKGKVYTYFKENIELINNKEKVELLVYEYKKTCHRCKKETSIKTYIIDSVSQKNLIFPWDKATLNNQKSAELHRMHMQHPKIEFYPIEVIGHNEKYDRLLMEAFPEDITIDFSNVQKRTYPMNHCDNCKMKQGEFFIFEDINLMIQRMEEVQVIKQINIK